MKWAWNLIDNIIFIQYNIIVHFLIKYSSKIVIDEKKKS